MSADVGAETSAGTPVAEPSRPIGNPAFGSTPAVNSGLLQTATCPLCHTDEAETTDHALTCDERWRCARCGQRWSARRIATVAAYAEWAPQRLDCPRGES